MVKAAAYVQDSAAIKGRVFTRTSPYHGVIPTHTFGVVTVTTSTAYSRDLGDELRRLRQRFTGLRGRAMALQLGWDPSKVSNLEHGKIRGTDIDLAQYLTVCGKDIDYFEDFLRRYHNAFDPCLAQAPDSLRTLAMTETMATGITAYDVLTVNSLLRTPQYARAVQAATGQRDRRPGQAGGHAPPQRPQVRLLPARAGVADAARQTTR